MGPRRISESATSDSNTVRRREAAARGDDGFAPPRNRVRRTRTLRDRLRRQMARQRARRRIRAASPRRDGRYDSDPDEAAENERARLSRRGGLHYAQRITDSRRRSPGKFTGKSLTKNRDRSAGAPKTAREAMSPSPVARAGTIDGVCTDNYGKVMKCAELITPTIWRKVMLKRNFPKNLVVALALDTTKPALARADRLSVLKYFTHAIEYVRYDDYDQEILNSDMVVHFVTNVRAVIGRIDRCVGNTSATTLLARKYSKRSGISESDFRDTLERSIGYNVNRNVWDETAIMEQAFFLLKTTKPTAVVLWGSSRDTRPTEARVLRVRRGAISQDRLDAARDQFADE